jgi:hypothetical protein
LLDYSPTLVSEVIASADAKIVFAPAIDINPINKHITKNKDFNDNDLVFILIPFVLFVF